MGGSRKAHDDDTPPPPAIGAASLALRVASLAARAGSCCSSSRACKGVVAAAIVLAVLLSGGVSASAGSVGGGRFVTHLGASRRACSSFVHVYLDDRSALEIPFILNSVLDGPTLLGACGLCVRFRPYAQFFVDLRAGLLDCTVAVFGHSVNADNTAMLTALKAHPRAALERVVFVHFSDEFASEETKHDQYPLVRTVFRNYDALGADVGYLLGNGTSPPSHVLWLPLGYTSGFLPMPALVLPMRDREWAWSWSGDGFGKVARKKFLAALSRSEPDAIHLGKLRVYDGFFAKTARSDGSYGNVALEPIEYSYWLHNSRVAPCPDGGSPEQYRIWEALSAGAVPIVSLGGVHLGYLDTLGFRVLKVRSWDSDEAPSFMRDAANDERFIKELSAMQEHNAALLARVYEGLHERFAAELCAAAGAPCSLGSGPCPATARVPAPSAEQCHLQRDGGFGADKGGDSAAPKF